MNSTNELRNATVPVIHTTNEQAHARCLSDRFGAWHNPQEPGFEDIAVRFPDSNSTHRRVAGDPRFFQITDTCFVAVRNDQLGILVEFELDAVLATSPEEGAAPTQYGEASYKALIEKYQDALAHLPAKWQPEAEIFLADGGFCFDDCLTVCAFVPLKGDMQKGFTSPFAKDDPRQMARLLSEMEQAVYGESQDHEMSHAEVDKPTVEEAPATVTVRVDDLANLVNFAKTCLPDVRATQSEWEILTAAVRRAQSVIEATASSTSVSKDNLQAPAL